MRNFITEYTEEELKDEIWLPIPGYCALVSNYGRVKLLKSGQITYGHPINKKDPDGTYLRVQLSDGKGDSKQCRVHKLVANAFCPNPYNKPEVNHKDGNHFNNKASNLEFMTHAENMRDAAENNRIVSGNDRIPVRIIELGLEFPSQIATAAYLGVNKNQVRIALNGGQNVVKGYHLERII